MDYKTMKKEDIGEWCKANKQVKWLKDFVAPNDEGKRPSFFEIKKAFCEKFMPEIIPVAKPKAPSMYDYFDNL